MAELALDNGHRLARVCEMGATTMSEIRACRAPETAAPWPIWKSWNPRVKMKYVF